MKWKNSINLERFTTNLFDKVYKKIWDIKEIKYVSNTDYGKTNGVDKIITLKNGDIIKIEEKIRDRKYKNKDIVIEEQSNVEKQTHGWIYYSESDYIAYSWFVNGLSKILIIDMKKLKEWYLKNKEKYKLVFTETNNLYHTSFRIIPIEDIKNMILYTSPLR